LNSVVYACFGIFISCLPKVTTILGHPWQTKFRGKLIVLNDGRPFGLGHSAEVTNNNRSYGEWWALNHIGQIFETAQTPFLTNEI